MHFTPETERDFVRDHLGALLRKRHRQTLLLACDDNKNIVERWADTVLDDPVAANFTDGVAFHWYSGDDFSSVAAVRRKHPAALLVATEATESGDANYSTSSSWSMGEHYSRDIMGDLNAGASAWIDWNVWLDVGPVLDGFHFGPSHYNPLPDVGGNNAMLVVDGVTGTVWPQAFYWHMGHLNRFIAPNATVLTTSCGAGAADSREEGAQGAPWCVSARNPDGTVAVVVQNPTSATVGCVVGLTKRSVAVNLDLPPRSIHTVLFPAPQPGARSARRSAGSKPL